MNLPDLSPMLPLNQPPRANVNYVHEIKWDGFRALAYVNQGVELRSRNGRSLNKRFPTLIPELEKINQRVIVDGEVVAFNREQGQQFSLLRGSASAATIYYVAFDLLFWDELLCARPWRERRNLLENLVTDRGIISLSPLLPGSTADCLSFVQQHRLEGIIAKVPDSPYLPGKRSAQWLKIKLTKTLDCVVVSINYRGKIPRSLGLALYQTEDSLLFIGNVGSGLGSVEKEFLAQAKKLLATSQCPVKNPPTKVEGVIWLQPHLVAEVEYLEFTLGGRLRHPVLHTFRFDKQASQCRLGAELE